MADFPDQTSETTLNVLVKFCTIDEMRIPHFTSTRTYLVGEEALEIEWTDFV